MCQWLLLVFQWGGLVRRCREAHFYDCYMEEAYEGVLSMISKYGPGRRLQGLSGVGIVCVFENILELYAPFLAASLGGSKTRMESSTAKDTDECKTHLCFEFISHAILSILYPYSCQTHKISSKLGFVVLLMKSK